jgi:hypothetical protein
MAGNVPMIYQIHVTLKNIEPPVWRRIQVPENIPLVELHDILQIVIGWEHAHLHAFRIGKVTYGEPDPYGPSDIQDECLVPLGGVADEGDSFIYDYDFGDDWEHDLRIEKKLAGEMNVDYPRCLDGARACPPEDCGGPWGYARLLEIVKDPKHEEHEEMLEWLGDEFDPEYFDVDEINRTIVEGGAVFEIPVFDGDILSAMTPDDLIDQLIDHDDRVPRNLIDECAARGDGMLDALAPFAQPDREEEEYDRGFWWLRLHAVMILGLISGERAGLLLFDYIRGMSSEHENDKDLQEWVGPYWATLFLNKPYSIVSHLRDYCEDRQRDWYMRCTVLEAVVALGQREGGAELEQALDWAAHIAGDENEDWYMRTATANTLLNMPRDRHKALLDDLAAQQSGLDMFFSKQEVADAYKRGEDKPEWERFSNPWEFYDTDKIEQRQRRWREQDQIEKVEDDFTLPEPPRIADYVHLGTYQRETPKIGRNDPCPCGSGKKYKKCCLDKQPA